MISYDEALAKAKELKPDIDNGTEYENGFVFGCTKDDMYEGGNHAPVVILKADGKAVTMPWFVINGTGEEVRTFEV